MKVVLSVLGILFFISSLFAHEPALPQGFVMEEGYISGLNSPTDLKIAPDGRIFITEKSGAVPQFVGKMVFWLGSRPFYTGQIPRKLPGEPVGLGMGNSGGPFGISRGNFWSPSNWGVFGF